MKVPEQVLMSQYWHHNGMFTQRWSFNRKLILSVKGLTCA